MATNRQITWSDVDPAYRRVVYRNLREMARECRAKAAETDNSHASNETADAHDAFANLMAAQDPACADLSRRGV